MQDTDRFCRQTLCDLSFVQYVNDTFLCWGGDIRKSDPFTVRLSVTSKTTLLGITSAFAVLCVAQKDCSKTCLGMHTRDMCTLLAGLTGFL